MPVAAAPLSDEDLRAAHGLRHPCLWGEPDPILDRNMQPLQLSDAERQLLRSVHDQPDTPLGELAEPAVIRDLAARQLLLLKV